MDLSELKGLLSLGLPKAESFKFLQPQDTFIFARFLSQSPNQLKLYEISGHYFLDVPGSALSGKFICHGHGPEEVCAVPHMCHVYGYWPDSSVNPKFKTIFEKKWKPIYGM